MKLGGIASANTKPQTAMIVNRIIAAWEMRRIPKRRTKKPLAKLAMAMPPALAAKAKGNQSPSPNTSPNTCCTDIT